MPALQDDSVYGKIILVTWAAILILNLFEKIKYNVFHNKVTEAFY